MIDKQAVIEILESLPFTTLDGEISVSAEAMTFSLLIDTQEGEDPLKWEVYIFPSYPMKIEGRETIWFCNPKLLPYPHIMAGGVLCIHTTDCLTPEGQLRQDLEQLKNWVDKYYVNKEVNEHYEHLVVNSSLVEGAEHHYLFTDLEEELPDNDYGTVRLCPLHKSSRGNVKTETYLACGFTSDRVYKSKERLCDWNEYYREYAPLEPEGLYCMLKQAPASYNKFILKSYQELDGLFTQTQKDYIHKKVKEYQRGTAKWCPVFCGYTTPQDRVHWQVLLLDIKHPPLQGISYSTPQGKVWQSIFTDAKILWANSDNASYEYFFGRGAMHSELAHKKIFIIGLGAVGSILAKTLVRCGARHIDLYDYDVKEPGNICRSEYEIFNGIGDKASELQYLLYRVSPFVDCRIKNILFDYLAKSLAPEKVQEALDEYDVIFDCTTDNHLMVLLDSLHLKAQVVNLSITNHAKELTCVFSPQVTKCIELLYSHLLEQAKSDMFHPSGCWNPTFRASYNDIALMVQYALRHCIRMLSGDEPISNFYLDDNDDCLTIHRL